jgi:hypothetical protein
MCQNVARQNATPGGDKSMKLLAVYAILVAVGEGVAVGLGELIELTYPSASLLGFLGLFFRMLWVAWRGALLVTRG